MAVTISKGTNAAYIDGYAVPFNSCDVQASGSQVIITLKQSGAQLVNETYTEYNVAAGTAILTARAVAEILCAVPSATATPIGGEMLLSSAAIDFTAIAATDFLASSLPAGTTWQIEQVFTTYTLVDSTGVSADATGEVGTTALQTANNAIALAPINTNPTLTAGERTSGFVNVVGSTKNQLIVVDNGTTLRVNVRVATDAAAATGTVTFILRRLT